jgi:hypothetical protein
MIAGPCAPSPAFHFISMSQLLAGDRVVRLQLQDTQPNLAGILGEIDFVVAFGQEGQSGNVIGLFFQNALKLIFGGLPAAFALINLHKFQPQVDIVGGPFDGGFIRVNRFLVIPGFVVILGDVLPEAGHLRVGEGLGMAGLARAAA